MKKRPLIEIADAINRHLEKFEADPVINKRDGKYDTVPYYYARACSSGRFVYVGYVSYQGQSYLTRAEAEAYLAWLDCGNVGKHFEQQRQAAKERESDV